MLILAIIVGYLLIGALIGLKETETLNEIEESARRELDGLPLWTLKLSLLTGSFFIMLVAPVLELYVIGGRCISIFKR